MNHELPQGWVTARILEIAETRSGGTPSTTKREYWDNGDVPWINSGALKDCVISQPSTYITKLGSQNSAAKLFPKNTVVIALTGATTGRVGMLGFACSAYQSVTGIFPSEVFVPSYVFNFLRFARPTVLELAIGSAQPHINKRIVDDFEIPLAPVDEQQRIVTKLEALLAKVDGCQPRLAKVATLLKRFRQSILAAAYSGRLTADWREENPDIESASRRWNIEAVPIASDDLPDLPESWVYRRLDDISERVSVTYVGPTSQYYCEKSEGVLYLRSQNVRPAKLDLTGSLYISRKFHELNKKSQLKPGDLLIVRVGANRGDACLLPEGLGDVNCGNVIVARPFAGISDFLNNYFQTPFCQASLQDLTTGSAQGVINTTVVAGVPVPIPPLGITPFRVDRSNRNNDIDDQILAEIRECDFVIADLTYARPSVYFEAGVAQGRDVPVIYTCRKDHFKHQPQDQHGNFRVHFDLQMKPIIQWSVKSNESFTKKLEKRIAHIIRPLLRGIIALQNAKAEHAQFAKLSVDDKKAILEKAYNSKIRHLGFDSSKTLSISIMQIGTKQFLTRVLPLSSLSKGDLAFIVRNYSYTGRDVFIQMKKQLRRPSSLEVHLFCLVVQKVSESRIAIGLPAFQITKTSSGLIARHQTESEPSETSFTYNKGNRGTPRQLKKPLTTIFVHVISGIVSERLLNDALDEHLKLVLVKKQASYV
jgi:type I restriction enzyme S subunit